MAEEKKPLEPIPGGLRSEEPDVRRVTNFVSRVCVYKTEDGWHIELCAGDLRAYVLPIANTDGRFHLPWLTEELRLAAFVSETQEGGMIIFYRPLKLRYRDTSKLTRIFVGGDEWKIMCELFDEALRRLNEDARPMGLWYAGPGWEADHKTRTRSSIVEMDRLLRP